MTTSITPVTGPKTPALPADLAATVRGKLRASRVAHTGQGHSTIELGLTQKVPCVSKRDLIQSRIGARTITH